MQWPDSDAAYRLAPLPEGYQLTLERPAGVSSSAQALNGTLLVSVEQR